MKYSIKRGGTLIDMINRHAAATGSMSYAMAAADADYNGHYVTVSFNDYRNYWVASYTWAGRRVLCRGTFEDCLRAAMAEHDRGAKFSTVMAYPLTEEQAATCEAHGMSIDDGSDDRFNDPRCKEIANAFMYERGMGIPAIGLLANSISFEDYTTKLRAEIAKHKDL